MYNPHSGAKATVADRAAAAASPSTLSQKGMAWNTGAERVTLTRLPFRQNIDPMTPGPAAYQEYEELHGSIARETRKASVSGVARTKGAASVGFRSSTPQRAPTEPLERDRAPPPGAYDTDPGWLTKSRTGDPARLLFASRQDRFVEEPPRTLACVGPGSYDPAASEHAAKDRSLGGKEGARSYPFNATDRRYRKGKTAPTELDVYMSADGRVY